MDRERGSMCPSGSYPRVGVPLRGVPTPIGGMLVALLVLGVALAPAAVAHPGPRATPVHAPARPSAASAPLTLLSQTPWVIPGGNFDLGLQASATAVPTSELGVSVAVYACLSSVSAFDQSVSSPPGTSGTAISSTSSPLPVSGLPALAGGGFTLAMPVEVGGGGRASPGGFTIDLASSGDQCGAYPSGVYPVRVALVDTSSHQVIAGITTHLVYSEARPDTQRLRFAAVLPVETAIPAAPSPSARELRARPAAALDPPSPTAVADLAALVGALAAHPDVPVTVEADPLTVDALSQSGHQSTVAALGALTGNPSIHQLASAPFAPVDASGLVDAGLASELDAQVARGTTRLQAAFGRPTATGGATDLGAWFTNDPVDDATLTQLQAEGYTQLVLPTGDVTAPPSNGSTAVPFPVATGHGPTVAVVTSNTDLASRFTDTPANPVLAAHQLLAELAQIYYEAPNDNAPRAVAVVAPAGWTADPSFVSALLGGLDGSPVVQAVTTAGLFATFPTLTPCRNGCRLSPATGDSGLPAAAIRDQRQRVTGFSSAAPTARALSTQLGELVLAGQSEALRPSQQSHILHNAGAAVDAQLAQLEVAGDRTVTLTSQQGTLPVDIVSAAPYPVAATLTVTSDKLLFPNGATEWTRPGVVALHAGTNIIEIPVRTRTSGQFTVDIGLHSPAGGLELSSGQVTLRSTATSVVGIALSLGAVVVLAWWWIRTSRRRRALRRAGDALDADAVAR